MSKNAGNGKKRKLSKAGILAVEVLVLLAVIGIYVLVSDIIQIERINIDTNPGTESEAENPENLPNSEVIIEPVENEDVKEYFESEAMKGYRNIALFGVDATNGALSKGTRTDTIMIASINQETGDVKLVSVYRDTVLLVSDGNYNKCNSAYMYGGPNQAIKMLNENLDLNIEDYVTVGFQGLVDTIDALGGIEIDVQKSEIQHLNNYQICIAENLKRSYIPVENTGLQTLNGLQATAYCRIRYTAGNDFKRTSRQRDVLMKLSEKAKKANISQLNEIANSVFPIVSTSITAEEIYDLLTKINDYQVVDQSGFPFDGHITTGKIGAKGDCVVAVDLETNVQMLHEFLFEGVEYTPSSQVKTHSQNIKNETDKYLNAPASQDNQADTPEEAPAE